MFTGNWDVNTSNEITLSSFKANKVDENRGLASGLAIFAKLVLKLKCEQTNMFFIDN